MNHRSPLFNFLLGVFFGACVSSAIIVHTITAQVEEDNRAATVANEERLRQLEETWKRQEREIADGCKMKLRSYAEFVKNRIKEVQ